MDEMYEVINTSSVVIIKDMNGKKKSTGGL